MALGRVTGNKWVQDGKISQGGYCTVQGNSKKVTDVTDRLMFCLGVIQQLGETGTTMATIASILSSRWSHNLI
jgi:hypothetical protein